MSRALQDIQLDIYKCVEKLQFSFYLDLLFSEIFDSLCSFVVFPKDCLFTCIFHSLLLVLYGITPDISIMLLYTFYQPEFLTTHDQHFPSESQDQAAYWPGFEEHCGDAMTHRFLDRVSQKIIYRSAVRPIIKATQ